MTQGLEGDVTAGSSHGPLPAWGPPVEVDQDALACLCVGLS